MKNRYLVVNSNAAVSEEVLLVDGEAVGIKRNYHRIELVPENARDNCGSILLAVYIAGSDDERQWKIGDVIEAEFKKV